MGCVETVGLAGSVFPVHYVVYVALVAIKLLHPDYFVYCITCCILVIIA